MSKEKKFIGLFTLIVAILLLVFISQFNKFQNITTHPSKEPIISAVSYDIPIDESDAVFGNPGAPITIVEFCSLDCRECRATHLLISDFVKQNPSNARLIWKDTAIPHYFFQTNKLAGASVYCASLQGDGEQFKFIETAMREKMSFNETQIKKVAQDAGLNADALWQCANTPDAQSKADTSMLLAQSLGIKSLPSVFVNNKKINLDEGVDLKKMLDKFVE
ncbi:DsbA family protein [Patescibacteria group bacterium]|nr:DsbA family protein [Patescibacteria group bacterium]